MTVVSGGSERKIVWKGQYNDSVRNVDASVPTFCKLIAITHNELQCMSMHYVVRSQKNYLEL